MRSERLQLDPTFPLCWESTETLRIGFETAQVRLLAPTPQEQRLIGRLSEGVSARELPMVAKKCGLSATDQHSLLQRLAPVLVRVRGSTASSRTAEVRRARRSAPRLHVIGQGTFAAELQRLFAREGVSSTLVPPVRPDEAAPSPPPLPEFAVIVERFFGAAAVPHELFSSGIPHFPICLTDHSVFAGPLVLPGQSPCLACVELHRVDADPLIAVLAAQIIRATPAAETLACAELAASLALIALRQWQTEESPDTAVRLRFPVRGGRPRYAPTAEDVLPHPECGCSLFQDAL